MTDLPSWEGHRAQLLPVACATLSVYDSLHRAPLSPIAPGAGRCAVTGSLETVNATDLLGWLANRDGELEFSGIYGNQRLELSVKGGGGHRSYDRATVLELGSSLAAVRRGG